MEVGQTLRIETKYSNPSQPILYLITCFYGIAKNKNSNHCTSLLLMHEIMIYNLTTNFKQLHSEIMIYDAIQKMIHSTYQTNTYWDESRTNLEQKLMEHVKYWPSQSCRESWLNHEMRYKRPQFQQIGELSSAHGLPQCPPLSAQEPNGR